MNEIQDIDTLTAEILILKSQTAQSIIEIGKRLIAVKESLPHGDFGKYLEEKVDFSQAGANRFMKVANEFSNSSALTNLSQTKIFALLDIPQEQREEFISTSHEVNGTTKTVDEMTTRELQKAIKERDEAVKGKNNAENKFQIYQTQLNQARIDAKQLEDEKQQSESKLKALEAALQKEKDNLKKEKENSKKEIAELQSFIGEAKESGNDEEVIRLQASLNEIQIDLDRSARKIDDLETQLEEKATDVITAEPVIIEKVPEEVEKELQELREKNSKNSDQSVVKFKIYYENLQSTFTSQLELIDEIKDTNPENHEKFKNAISKLLSKMAERL